MDEQAPRPQATKELLIQDGHRRLGTRYRQAFAAGLLADRTGLPVRWLNPEQVVFVELAADSTVESEICPAARELTGRVADLCDLVYALLDDFARQHKSTYDRNELARLRRGGGPSLICKVLASNFRQWPPTDPRKIDSTVRTEIDEVLRQAMRREQDSPSTGAAVPAGGASSWPTDDRALAVWDRTRATDDPEKLKRYILLDLAEAFVKTVPVLMATVTLAIVYLALFLALRHFSPDLTTREDMIIAGAAITAALGGSGAMLAGQAIKTRWGGPGGAGPKPGG